MTGDKYAVEVSNITKKFRLYDDKGYTLKEKALHWGRNRYEYREVLKGISFQIKKGEAVGLIGQNGCGKSTVLKLLTKIMYPDSGTICVRGRVSSLLELGAGFHPDMSGRENIYINASILGLTKKEIDRRIDSIIAFSELEEFIDNPVRTYSSGMYMRLAFAVAIHVDADILLVDEILAVGDAGFQIKCLNYLKDMKANGTTIVIVSHAMGQIEQICDRSIWINEGKIVEEGNPKYIGMKYLEYIGEHRQRVAEKNLIKEGRIENSKKQEKTAKETLRWGNGNIVVEAVRLLNNQRKESTCFQTDMPVTIQIDYKVDDPIEDVAFGIAIYRTDGVSCYGTNTMIDKLDKLHLVCDGTMEFAIDALTLLPGTYLLDVAIQSDNGMPMDYYKKAYKFEMFSNIEDVGISRIKHHWILCEK